MRTIASLLYPDVMSLDVSGPLQVFASANVELRRLGQAEAYRLLVLGEHAGPMATSAGFQSYNLASSRRRSKKPSKD